MLSMGKLLALIAAILVVWYGYKLLGPRIKAALDRRDAPPAKSPAIATETERCRACGTYVTAGARSCGRGDCPYPA